MKSNMTYPGHWHFALFNFPRLIQVKTVNISDYQQLCTIPSLSVRLVIRGSVGVLSSRTRYI